jgi:hypothetical protein
LDLVIVTKGPRNSRIANHYALNLNLTTGRLVHNLDQSKILTSATSPQIRPQLVHNSDSLKPKKPNKKEGTESDRLIPDSLSTKEKKRKPARPDPAQLEAFDRFYTAYPLHKGRDDALKAWLKLNPSAELTATIMAAAERYVAEVQNTDQKYIKHPGPWLNGKRWEDEPANGNGHAKPPEVKDLGNGWLEVDGLRISQKDYDRRWKQA